MATFNMNPYSNTATTPPTLPSADQGYGGIIKMITGQLAYASQASGSVLVLGTIPAGSCFVGGYLYTDTSTGSATLAVGGTLGGAQSFQANCYKVAAAITSTDVLTWFLSYVSATHPFLTQMAANATTPGLQPYAAAETIKVTTAAAALPSSGNLFMTAFYM